MKNISLKSKKVRGQNFHQSRKSDAWLLTSGILLGNGSDGFWHVSSKIPIKPSFILINKFWLWIMLLFLIMVKKKLQFSISGDEYHLFFVYYYLA